jgi:uncharacterized protein
MGKIGWIDLTVRDAPAVRDFYSRVANWRFEPVSMGDYDDYSMLAGDDSVAGICHARGENEGLPAAWLVYIGVDDLDASIAAAATSLGGRVISQPRGPAEGPRFAVLSDPVGAAFALIQDAAAQDQGE